MQGNLHADGRVFRMDVSGPGSQGHEMYCLNLEDMGLNPGQVEIEVCSTQYSMSTNRCRSLTLMITCVDGRREDDVTWW